MPIKRYSKEPYLEKSKKDFALLFKALKGYKGELDLAFRNNYFNLYYRGNSVAKIDFKKDGDYKITIHERFYPDEQMLITDNLEGEEIILIDRQITDSNLNRRRIDLLGLKQAKNECPKERTWVIPNTEMGFHQHNS